MKATLRIPTAQQYSYIEIQTEGTLEEIVSQYHEAMSKVTAGEGVTDKEFDSFLEYQLSDGSQGIATADIYTHMSPEQQKYVQANKRCIKRLKAKSE